MDGYATKQRGNDGRWWVRCMAFPSSVYFAMSEADAETLAQAINTAHIVGSEAARREIREALGIEE